MFTLSNTYKLTIKFEKVSNPTWYKAMCFNNGITSNFFTHDNEGDQKPSIYYKTVLPSKDISTNYQLHRKYNFLLNEW